jgi:hypothetical protein
VSVDGFGRLTHSIHSKHFRLGVDDIPTPPLGFDDAFHSIATKTGIFFESTISVSTLPLTLPTSSA